MATRLNSCGKHKEVAAQCTIERSHEFDHLSLHALPLLGALELTFPVVLFLGNVQIIVAETL
jgi:hypothetical protein